MAYAAPSAYNKTDKHYYTFKCFWLSLATNQDWSTVHTQETLLQSLKMYFKFKVL